MSANVCIPTPLLLAILAMIGSEHMPNQDRDQQSIYAVSMANNG